MIDRRLKRIPGIIVLAYVLFLAVTSFDAFQEETVLWRQFGMFLYYNIPGICLLFFLSVFWQNLLVCGEAFLVLSGMLSLCFSPWQAAVTWMLLVFPLFLAAVLYLLLYYWEKHYQFFS